MEGEPLSSRKEQVLQGKGAGQEQALKLKVQGTSKYSGGKVQGRKARSATWKEYNRKKRPQNTYHSPIAVKTLLASCISSGYNFNLQQPVKGAIYCRGAASDAVAATMMVYFIASFSSRVLTSWATVDLFCPTAT